MKFSELSTGDLLPGATITLDALTVARYLMATGDDNALYWRDGDVVIVPPLAVGALAVRHLAALLTLEAGALHTSQELTAHRRIAVGETLRTEAHVSASSRRRGALVLALELRILSAADADDVVASGAMTLMIAAADPESPAGPSIDTPTLDRPVTWPAPDEWIRQYYPTLTADATVGQQLGPLYRQPTQSMIDRYAVASGDYNPVHLDLEFASHTPFGQPIAHGFLLLAYLSTLLTQRFGAAWLESGSIKVKFRNPALAASTVVADGEVKRYEEINGVQYAVSTVQLVLESGETLLSGDARVSINGIQ